MSQGIHIPSWNIYFSAPRDTGLWLGELSSVSDLFFSLSLTYHLLRVRLIQHCVCLNFGLSRRQHDTYEIRSTNIIIVLLSQIEHCIRTHP